MSSMFDPVHFRPDFPILNRQVHGKPLVYLDSAATSQKPQAVIDAIVEYYTQHNANVHRGVHQLGDESTKLYHQSRQKIAAFLGADARELVITRNQTEAANQIAYSWGDHQVQAGDVLLATEMEHHSNLVPWQELAQRRQAHLQLVNVDAQGRLDLQDLEEKLQQKAVKLLALTHVSNTLGTHNPLSTIVELVRRYQPQALIFVDGAQAAPHVPVNFHELDVDCYSVSAHKMLGPMGIGAVLVKLDLLKKLPPFFFGGGMIDQVHADHASFAEDLEDRFTAGTPDVASLVGWAAACEYLQKAGMSAALEHDRVLVAETLKVLAKFPQIQVIGPTQPLQDAWPLDRVGSVAFVYQGVHAHDVGQVLDSEGVAVRSGHHCTMPLHLKFGWVATTRVSFQLYTTLNEIEALGQALTHIKKIFGV